MMHLLRKATFRISTAPPIVVNYSDLVNDNDLKPVIEQAYGPKGISL